MELSSLTDMPKHYPDCCLAISQPLVQTLLSALPRAPQRVMSIGSGSGLLEATLLRSARDAIDIVGVEVSPTVNKHLLEQNTLFINGTWALHSEARSAAAWMFVYPREPRLVKLYLDVYASKNLELTVWLGPRCDWPDYAPIFKACNLFRVALIEDCGAASYEMMAIMNRI